VSTLLVVTAASVLVGGFMLNAQAIDSTSQDLAMSPVAVLNNTNIQPKGFNCPGWDGHSFGVQNRVFHGFGEGIEVSANYTQKVTNILNADSDVQSLISQGYNITSIKPVLSRTLDGNGIVTTKATTAIVRLVKGSSGYATVSVNVDLGQVSRIVILTRTVIDKTTS
jgi:hypothetical protein